MASANDATYLLPEISNCHDLLASCRPENMIQIMLIPGDSVDNDVRNLMLYIPKIH